MSVELDEDELYDLSDEELEAQVKEAKAALKEADNEPDDESTVEDEPGEEPDKPEEDQDDTTDDEGDEPIDDDTVDPEQPDEDSDNAADADDDKDDDTKESDEDKSDDPEVTTEDTPKAEDKPQTYKIKANGMDYEFTVEELAMMAPKAMDYTKKLQTLAPWRKAISAFEEAGINSDDVNRLIEVAKGDKDAITDLLKQTGIDPITDLDIEKELNYTPNDYGKSESEIAIDEVLSEIKNDQEFTITQHVVDQQWDAQSRAKLASDPRMIKGLHIDIKNGVYDKVAPMAMKMKVLDDGRKSDLDYYLMAGQQYIQQEQAMTARAAEQAKLQEIEAQRAAEEAKRLAEVEAAKQVQAKQKTVKKASQSRKAAGLPKGKAGTNRVTDYLDDTDEAFEEWYKKLQASM